MEGRSEFFFIVALLLSQFYAQTWNCAVAQAASCWPLTVEAHVHAPVHAGFLVDKVALEQVFLQI
jgi:hypothetical protein